MAYTALQLITRAYYLSGVVAREFETVSGTQIQDGLYLLNALLDYATVNTRLIPYWGRSVLNLVAGQEKYFVEGLRELETFTFNIGPVRYPVTEVNRIHYFGNGRVDNIVSIPFICLAEKAMDGMDIYVYFLPDQDYVANITGKYQLSDVTLTTDLSTVYDKYYIEYLRYSLAQYICLENIIEFPQMHEAQLEKMIKQLSWQSPPDLTMKKTTLINNQQSINWSQINLGRGFFP